MIKKTKSCLSSQEFPGKNIVCVFCDSSGVFKNESIESMFPDAKVRYDKSEHHLGHVVNCYGNKRTVIADMICLENNKVNYGYLYGCFLQVVMKAKLAEANILLMSPGCKITENQWHKIKPILEGALEKEGPDVDVIVCLSNDDNVIRVRYA